LLGGVILQENLGRSLQTLFDSSNSGNPASTINSLEGRVEIWSRALYAIQDVPFTGMGMNVFRNIVHKQYPLFLISPSTDIAHAHNEFLQAALDLGIPGLIAFMALYLGACTMLWQSWNAANSQISTQDSPNWLAVFHSPHSTRMLILGMGGGLLAHMIYGLTDAVALGAKPGLLFWMLLGLITGLFKRLTLHGSAFDSALSTPPNGQMPRRSASTT
jgi:putative inorganic carbon (HCO3(-)) transporter